MRIGLDYDKTYSADPPFWDEFIRMSRARGHEVRIVTARDERHDCTAELFALSRRVIIHWTRGVAKKWWMANFSMDWIPDIVIDDKPESWLENSTYTPDKLLEWRSTRGEGHHYGRA